MRRKRRGLVLGAGGVLGAAWTIGALDALAETEGFALTHVRHPADARHLANLVELFRLASPLEDGLQFERDVEMILHRALAATRDDSDVGDT